MRTRCPSNLETQSIETTRLWPQATVSMVVSSPFSFVLSWWWYLFSVDRRCCLRGGKVDPPCDSSTFFFEYIGARFLVSLEYPVTRSHLYPNGGSYTCVGRTCKSRHIWPTGWLSLFRTAPVLHLQRLVPLPPLNPSQSQFGKRCSCICEHFWLTTGQVQGDAPSLSHPVQLLFFVPRSVLCVFECATMINGLLFFAVSLYPLFSTPWIQSSWNCCCDSYGSIDQCWYRYPDRNQQRDTRNDYQVAATHTLLLRTNFHHDKKLSVCAVTSYTLSVTAMLPRFFQHSTPVIWFNNYGVEFFLLVAFSLCKCWGKHQPQPYHLSLQ